MAKQKQAGKLPAEFDPEKLYRVRFKTRDELLGQKLYPGRDYQVRGDHLKTVAVSLESAEPI